MTPDAAIAACALPSVLERYLPDVNDRVRAGHLDPDDARAAWRALEREFVPPPRAVILHGSVAHGRARPFSDIDLLVLVDGAGKPEHHVRSASGYLVDLTILPIGSITAAAQRFGMTRLSGEVTGLLEGKMICGDAALVARAGARVRQIVDTMGDAVERLIQGMEARVFGRLVDFAFATRGGERFAIVTDVYTLCAAIASLRETGQLLPVPVAMERLPNEMRVLLSAIRNGNSLSCHRFAELVVEGFGLRTFDRWDQMYPQP